MIIFFLQDAGTSNSTGKIFSSLCLKAKTSWKRFYHPPFVPSSLKIMWAGSIFRQNYLLTCPNCKSIKYSFVSANTTTLSHFIGFLELWNSVKSCGLPQANYFICHQRSLRRGCQQIFIFLNFFSGGKFVFSELQPLQKPQPEDQCEKKQTSPQKELNFTQLVGRIPGFSFATSNVTLDKTPFSFSFLTWLWERGAIGVFRFSAADENAVWRPHRELIGSMMTSWHWCELGFSSSAGAGLVFNFPKKVRPSNLSRIFSSTACRSVCRLKKSRRSLVIYVSIYRSASSRSLFMPAVRRKLNCRV